MLPVGEESSRAEESDPEKSSMLPQHLNVCSLSKTTISYRERISKSDYV